MLNIGVIGLGHVGMLHLQNCLHVDGIRVTAVADQTKTALTKAKSIGIKNAYTDYHDLFNESYKIDAVVVSLPNFLHFDSIRLALEAGLDVFVEKPLATSVEECRKIVRLTQRSGRKLMIGHSMRFLGAVEQMKTIADAGQIGDLEVVTLEQILNGPLAHGAVPKPVSDWWFDPKKTGGGVLLDLGYHMIDLFLFIVGEPSEVLFSCFDHKFNLAVEDGAILILRSSETGVKAIINTGWYQKCIFPAYNFRMILHGNAGYVSSDDFIPRNIYLHAFQEGMMNLLRKVAGRKTKPLSYSYYYEPYYKELEHFFDCVREDKNPSVSETDGLRTLEIIEEARAHAKTLIKKRFPEGV